MTENNKPFRPKKLSVEEIKSGCVYVYGENSGETQICVMNEEFRQGFDIVKKNKDGNKSVTFWGSARFPVENEYYQKALRLGRRLAQDLNCMIVTGGGPGIMEAGNRGAHEVGGKSLGLNIVLPHEQAPNPYITPELCFQFHYFAIRKMHFLMRAVALVSFPGGLGTLDELFEVLTLTQTRKIRRRPIVLIGRDFWQRLIDFDVLVEHGVISPEDKNLFHYAETAEEAWDAIKAAYSGDNPSLTARQLKGN